MADPNDIEDDQLTRIVSYLDGELDEAETMQVEQQLIADPDLRDRAEKLSRTWSMLDELDEISASQQFTQDTLTSIVAESTTSPSRKKSDRWRIFSRFLAKHRIVPCFIAGLLGGGIGLIRSESTETRPRGFQAEQKINEALLSDFELLQNYAQYTSVPGLEELRQLNFVPGGGEAGDSP